MDVIASIPLIGGPIATILPFVVVLGIVVAVHEYGHYIVARWCGIQSEVFSIGFGPVLWSRRDKRGTLWQIAALPLGGYVKFLGDSDGSSRADNASLDRLPAAERARSFHGASVGRRMLTVLAGPAFNFLLTIAVFAGLALWQGMPTERPTVGEVRSLPGVEQLLAPGDVLLEVNGTPVVGFEDLFVAAQAMPAPGPMQVRVERDGAPVELTVPYALPALIGGIEPLSPASEAGLRRGDLVLEADGRALHSFNDLRDAILASGQQTVVLEIWRNGDTFTLPVTPKERDIESEEGGFKRQIMIGAASGPLYLPETSTPSPWLALSIGVERMFGVINQSLSGISAIISGAIGLDNLQGPIGIAQISGEAAAQGLLYFVALIGIISTAIGLLNLFPIPVLDGGHFVAFLIEAIRGRPPSPAVMQVAMSIGLGLILLLMVFATYNDIMRNVS
jgi:regulator of sigma E protease